LREVDELKAMDFERKISGLLDDLKKADENRKSA